MLKKISVGTTVDVIVDQIIKYIIDGVFQPGQQIPTESELASSFGVGRNSVREAVKILTAYGILEIRRAGGTFVRSEFSPKMLNPMVYGIILSKDYSDLVEVRKAVEYYAYVLAIQKATEEDLQLLQGSIDRYTAALEQSPNDYTYLADLDAEVHEYIFRCGHNQILSQINKIVCMLLYESRLQTIKEIIERGDIQFLFDIHKSCYDLIRYHQVDKISTVIDHGIMNWDTYLKRRAEEENGARD